MTPKRAEPTPDYPITQDAIAHPGGPGSGSMSYDEFHEATGTPLTGGEADRRRWRV
jgi:hypothetical protein